MAVSQLRCGLSDPVGQRIFDNVVTQCVDQRAEEAIAVRGQHNQFAEAGAHNGVRCHLTTQIYYGSRNATSYNQKNLLYMLKVDGRKCSSL